jgi:tRNA pseudouridine38-40 synthase
MGSGRTDAGVHAKHQVFHFDGRVIMNLNKLKYTLNKMLPNDIEVIKINYAKLDFPCLVLVLKRNIMFIEF